MVVINVETDIITRIAVCQDLQKLLFLSVTS